MSAFRVICGDSLKFTLSSPLSLLYVYVRFKWLSLLIAGWFIMSVWEFSAVVSIVSSSLLNIRLLISPTEKLRLKDLCLPIDECIVSMSNELFSDELKSFKLRVTYWASLGESVFMPGLLLLFSSIDVKFSAHLRDFFVFCWSFNFSHFVVNNFE